MGSKHQPDVLEPFLSVSFWWTIKQFFYGSVGPLVPFFMAITHKEQLYAIVVVYEFNKAKACKGSLFWTSHDCEEHFPHDVAKSCHSKRNNVFDYSTHPIKIYPVQHITTYLEYPTVNIPKLPIK